jgi:hypothetical protein
MNKVLNDVVGLVPERPASLPVVGPPPGALREAYLESLMVGDHQGECDDAIHTREDDARAHTQAPLVPLRSWK